MSKNRLFVKKKVKTGKTISRALSSLTCIREEQEDIKTERNLWSILY